MTTPITVPGLPGITDVRMCPNAESFREFYGGYHGTCGETALATALVVATPPIESQAQAIALMLSMTKELIGLKWAAASGSTTMGRLHDEAIRRKFAVDAATFISYKEPLDQTELHNLLLTTAGVKPILIEIARAGNLPGDEKGVQYHFICVVGICHQGYIVNDGDNAAANAHLVLYTFDQIMAARPCAQMVIDLQAAPKPAPVPVEAPSPVVKPAPTPTPTPAPAPVQTVALVKYNALVAAVKAFIADIQKLLS